MSYPARREMSVVVSDEFATALSKFPPSNFSSVRHASRREDSFTNAVSAFGAKKAPGLFPLRRSTFPAIVFCPLCPATTDVSFSLLVLCSRSLLTHWNNSCWADWPAQAGNNRKAGRGKSTKLKLLLLYSIYATYRR